MYRFSFGPLSAWIFYKTQVDWKSMKLAQSPHSAETQNICPNK